MQVQIDEAVRGPFFQLKVYADDIRQWSIEITGNLTKQLYALFGPELDEWFHYMESSNTIESAGWLSQTEVIMYLAAITVLMTQVEE